jgi:hypothetical protein
VGRQQRNRARPPRLPTPGPLRTRPPRRGARIVGPGDPPLGFNTGHTSVGEWYLYWALSRIFEDPDDPRRPPYNGGQRWSYQSPIFGGRDELGGLVIDFVVRMPHTRDVAIDLVSGHYHTAGGPERRAIDRARLRAIAQYLEVVQIFEVNLILDSTGQQAVSTLIEALGGRSRIDPDYGTYQKARAGRLFT